MYLRDTKPVFDSMHEECGVFGVYFDRDARSRKHRLLRAVRVAAPGTGELRQSRWLTPTKSNITRAWG